ncbi:TPA: GNAT family N-acetyltransferase [Legionella pneumophila]
MKLLKQPEIIIKTFTEDDISIIVDEFARHNWPKPRATFELYWNEQLQKERQVWLAYCDDKLAGYVTLKRNSFYSPFQENRIPEIMDLNVLPPFRNKGIGSLLLDIAEEKASEFAQQVGIGFGLYKDYGFAQKLYVKRGYIPDGLGVTYNYIPVIPGAMYSVDDDLVLWLIKSFL